MKVFVYFQPKKKNSNFEGERFKKTIRNALELNDVSYTSNVIEKFDIIHLISPLDEDKINLAKENDLPVVVSALYVEDDPAASYLEYKNKDGRRIVELSSKALKFLNRANLVLVPCEFAKDYLLNAGVTSDIQVSFPGINISRFDFSREDEKNIFYRYFREQPGKKLIISIGEYEGNLEGINALISAAKMCPNAVFYFIGHTTNMNNVPLTVKKIIKNAPKNLHFTNSLPDDVYRSALLNADVFTIACYRPASILSLSEAMMAKCQIIVRKQAIFPGLLVDGVNAYVAEFSETIASLISDYLDGNLKPTITESYNFVKQYSLQLYGEKLKWFYQETINDNNFRRNNHD